ncbi:hypothetical protein [Methanospirillum hungatei]|uniref:hypothetical protein n=1 Tax=Methanospirillum hungatei TaxID=2203 RepID=UPI0026E93B0B|nr:hypothetical protein [Methanospirillum hungatei]MCA1915772.1 hypothetical protein [Methanospirillum hungatei]
MTLEEKIARLSPRLRAQVEDYVDFLVSRTAEEDHFSGVSPDEDEGEPVQPIPPSPPEIPVSKTWVNVRERTGSSGIILAEERLPETDPDYIDFADINSRFGHTPKDDEEKKTGRLKRFLDWM